MILPLACVVVFVIVQSPVILVLIAGVTQLLMLPVIGFSAIYFRYFETDKRLRPGLAWDAFLILSSLAMLFVGAWGIYNKTKSAKIMQVFTARRTDQPDPVGIYPSRDEALAKAADDPDHEYVISECNFPVPPPTSRHGAVGWIDLTVSNAAELKPFYEQVVGWTTSEISMGDYNDFCLHPIGEEQPTAGLCHAKGPNEGIPPAWLIYVTVENIDQSINAAKQLGGEILQERNATGYGRIAIIKDPNGTPLALFTPQPE